MLHSPPWKVIAALMAMLASVAFVTSPGFSAEARKKTHIVAELQSQELLNTLFVRLAADVRAALREAGIGYKTIKPTPNGGHHFGPPRISAPRIVQPIPGGSGQISADLTREDADSLVLVLRSGALPAPITFISMTTKDP
jgi:preprotein translocase subunit SecD